MISFYKAISLIINLRNKSILGLLQYEGSMGPATLSGLSQASSVVEQFLFGHPYSLSAPECDINWGLCPLTLAMRRPRLSNFLAFLVLILARF